MKLTWRKAMNRDELLRELAPYQPGDAVSWSILHSRGIHFATVKAAVRDGVLQEWGPYHYRLTSAALSEGRERGE